MTDRIKPLKYENTTEGSQNNTLMTEMNPLEDTLPVYKKIEIVDDEANIDKTTTIQQGVSVDANHEVCLFDRVSGTVKLSTLKDKSVATDSTLSGDGTTANPLSVSSTILRHRLIYTFENPGLIDLWADIGSISSQYCGAPISLTTPTIESIEVTCKNSTANFTFGIYQHDGNQANASLIKSVTISGVNYQLTSGLTDALTAGKQLSIKSTDVTALPGDVVIVVTVKGT